MTACKLTRSATRKPRLVGGDKGRNNRQNTSLPGSPALRAGSFTLPYGRDIIEAMV